MKPTYLLAVAAVTSMPLRAQACAELLDLGTLPGGSSARANGVSADGSVVVGSSNPTAFRWTAAGGMQDLGTLGGNQAWATSVSADGSVVVGGSYTITAGIARAFRWTAAGGMQDLGILPAFDSSYAYGTSADGSVVVGHSLSNTSSTGRAFRWTPAGGMQDLGTLPGSGDSSAYGVSADGSVVVGWSLVSTSTYRAFRWTAAGGMQDLGTLPGGARAYATGVSADGSVVVGRSGASSGWRAFRWTAGVGMQDLGTLPGFLHSDANGVSADGSVVVGQSFSATSGVFIGPAFRWTAAGGMQDLGTPPVFDRSYATGVSADGSVVVGSYDSIASGVTRAFRVQSSVMGTTYCRPTLQNSTGCSSVVLARGSLLVASNSLELRAVLLPPNATGFFLTSRNQGSTFPVNNSQGKLCLGGFIGRYVGPGQVLNSGAVGSFSLALNLATMPQPFGDVAAQPGETWNFQAWHRDANPTLTSNFTDAVSITFQ